MYILIAPNNIPVKLSYLYSKKDIKANNIIG